MLQAFFCDHAELADGKLHIHGIFNELMAEGFPARQDRLVLCGILKWPASVVGQQDFKIDLQDPTGKSIFTVEGHTVVTKAGPGRAPAQTNLVLPLENVVFPTAGCYQTHFQVSGQQMAGPELYLHDSRAIG